MKTKMSSAPMHSTMKSPSSMSVEMTVCPQSVQTAMAMGSDARISKRPASVSRAEPVLTMMTRVMKMPE